MSSGGNVLLYRCGRASETLAESPAEMGSIFEAALKSRLGHSFVHISKQVQ
jgi:hypothetical protein